MRTHILRIKKNTSCIYIFYFLIEVAVAPRSYLKKRSLIHYLVPQKIIVDTYENV